jgi:biopolymer transport protein ExbD
LRDESIVKPIADINMTNLVDVTLTLLILFILIAPVIDEGFTLHLPSATSENIRTAESLTLVVDWSRKLQLEGKVVSIEGLSNTIEGMSRLQPDQGIVILADTNLDYGFIIKIMDILRSSGMTNISLATSEGDSK